MAEIDPIQERREREEQEKKNESLKKVMWILVAVAVLLAAGLAYIWFSKSSLVKDLNAEKDDLTQQMIALRGDYDSLSSDYASINSQLDSSKEEVNQLIERIQKTEATNRRKMRQYEKELGTLRSIMKNYIVQIDSLNTLNHKLTADAAAARRGKVVLLGKRSIGLGNAVLKLFAYFVLSRVLAHRDPSFLVKLIRGSTTAISRSPSRSLCMP